MAATQASVPVQPSDTIPVAALNCSSQSVDETQSIDETREIDDTISSAVIPTEGLENPCGSGKLATFAL